MGVTEHRTWYNNMACLVKADTGMESLTSCSIVTILLLQIFNTGLPDVSSNWPSIFKSNVAVRAQRWL